MPLSAVKLGYIVPLVSLLLVGCDSGVPPTSGKLAAVEIQPPDPRVELQSTLQLEVTLVDQAGNPLNGRNVFWSSENSAVAEVSESGVVTGKSIGSTRVAASAEGVDAITTVTVVPLGVASVSLDPGSVEIEVGQDRTLTAVARDRNGDVVEGRPVSWTSEHSTIAVVNGSGQVTGVGPGSTSVTASVDGQSAKATVTVDPVSVASVRISPTTASLTLGGTRQFAATPLAANGDPITGRTVNWSSSRPDVASVSASGLVEAKALGSAKITATVGGKSAEASINIVAVSVASVAISPTSAAMTVGGTRQFTATPRDSDGDPLTGRAITWSTSNASVVTVSASGLAEAKAAGTAKITATVEGKSAEATVTVAAAPVASVTVSPISASLTVGGTQQITATPRDSDGDPLTGRAITWSTSNASVVTVSASGLAEAKAAGTAKITATVEGKSAEATVTVAAAPVASVTVSPISASLTVGGTQQFTATPRDSDGDPLTGRAITWSTSNASVVTVSASGLAEAKAAGTAKITATVEGKSAEATVTVAAAPVASVTVSPSSASLAVGGTQQFTATPLDADGSPLSGRAVSWSSSNPGVVSVSDGGLALAVAPGAANVTAMIEGKTADATVSVTVVPVAIVEISPTSAEIPVLETRQFTVTLKAADGTALTGREVTWSSSNPAVASVSASGLVAGLLPGEATITVASEGKEAEAAVQVVGVASEAASLEMVSGDDQQGNNNEPLGDPLVVRLLDADDRPVAGVEVRWATNNGAVSPVTTLTDSNGIASTQWTLGGGNRELTRRAWAEVDDLPRVEFRAYRY
jgi:trimeric autotransporter adhesin